MKDGQSSSDSMFKPHDSSSSNVSSHSGPKAPKTWVRDPETFNNQRICLFCNIEASCVKNCLFHMKTQHSFFIYEIESLVDLKGLLDKLTDKVHRDKECIKCNKKFDHGSKVQAHMKDKAHCQMDLQTFYTEFKAYFDFDDNIQFIKEGSSRASSILGAED